MDQEFLLRFVGLIALFAAVSILTVASLTLTQNISNTIFKPGIQKPYLYMVGPAGSLRASILVYSQKVYKLYLLVSILIALPTVMPIIATYSGGYEDIEGGFVWFGDGFVASSLNGIVKYYPTVCLGFIILYAVYIVRKVTAFKDALLQVLDS